MSSTDVPDPTSPGAVAGASFPVVRKGFEPTAVRDFLRRVSQELGRALHDQRLPSAPDIPTVDEAGLPQLHLSIWFGLWAPRGTPKDVIVKLNAAVKDALADPTIREKLAALGQVIPPTDKQSPEALAAHQKAEIDKWWPIVKAANIKVESN